MIILFMLVGSLGHSQDIFLCALAQRILTPDNNSLEYYDLNTPIRLNRAPCCLYPLKIRICPIYHSSRHELSPIMKRKLKESLEEIEGCLQSETKIDSILQKFYSRICKEDDIKDDLMKCGMKGTLFISLEEKQLFLLRDQIDDHYVSTKQVNRRIYRKYKKYMRKISRNTNVVVSILNPIEHEKYQMTLVRLECHQNLGFVFFIFYNKDTHRYYEKFITDLWPV